MQISVRNAKGKNAYDCAEGFSLKQLLMPLLFAEENRLGIAPEIAGATRDESKDAARLAALPPPPPGAAFVHGTPQTNAPRYAPTGFPSSATAPPPSQQQYGGPPVVGSSGPPVVGSSMTNDATNATTTSVTTKTPTPAASTATRVRTQNRSVGFRPIAHHAGVGHQRHAGLASSSTSSSSSPNSAQRVHQPPTRPAADRVEVSASQSVPVAPQAQGVYAMGRPHGALHPHQQAHAGNTGARAGYVASPFGGSPVYSRASSAGGASGGRRKIEADGFVTTVGNPELAAQYGNSTQSRVHE